MMGCARCAGLGSCDGGGAPGRGQGGRAWEFEIVGCRCLGRKEVNYYDFFAGCALRKRVLS